MIKVVYGSGPWLGTWTAFLAPGETGRGIRPGVPQVDPRALPGVDELQMSAIYDVVVPSGSDHLQVETVRVPCAHGSLAWWEPALRLVLNWFMKAPGPLAIVLVGGWSNDEDWHWRRARTYFRKALAGRPGRSTICAPPLDLRNTCIEALSVQVEGILRLVSDASPEATLCVYGHSTGALIVRIAVERLLASRRETGRDSQSS